MRKSTEPSFWRDPTLPFIEARAIHDGRRIRYAKHAHETFSIGSILAGHCVYVNGSRSQRIGAGSVVVMNPGDAHACNPSHDERWSYRMLYIDAAWLAGDREFQPFSAVVTRHPELFAALNRLYELLIDSESEHLEKHGAALEFITLMHGLLSPADHPTEPAHPGLLRAVEFIKDNYTRSLKLEEICAAADLSPSYLIRAFKQEYGMTPHAYLITTREREVLGLMTNGLSNTQIAEALDLGEGTVRNHVSSILSKLGVADRTKAVLLALQQRLV